MNITIQISKVKKGEFMMKAIAINGSPRKDWNTGTLLKKAVDGAASLGAETEVINLYELDYKGCISCFACKRKVKNMAGHCAMKDDLTGVLEKAVASDVLLLGSPIYLGDITGAMRSFLERLVFMNLSFEDSHRSNFTGKISAGFIYTMGLPRQKADEFGYQYNFNIHMQYLQLLNGATEYLVSTDTYQFDDYSKYKASRFDEKHKAKIRADQFPVDCQSAYDMGARLAAPYIK